MSRLEHTDMILYNDTILNKLNITINAKYKNKKNGQDLIMTQDTQFTCLNILIFLLRPN